MKVNDRVEMTGHPFLSDGYIKKIVEDWYIIKLDEYAPNTYAWETDEVLMSDVDLKVIGTK